MGNSFSTTVAAAPVSTTLAQDLSVKTPRISTAYDEPLYRRQRAVQTTQGAVTTLALTLRDDCGNPVDIAQYGFLEPATGRIEARFRESSLLIKDIVVAAGTVVDATTGSVSVLIPQTEIMDVAGIYTAQLGVFNADDELVFANELYLYNEKSPWILDNRTGPLSVSDIRLSLRDSDPIINELIENYDFDLAEIAWAATRVCLYWNDSLPPVGNAMFSTAGFPFREIWLQGIQAFLYGVAEEHYRRNHFRYAAGGTTIDDKNRHQVYGSATRQRMAEFRRIVMHRKAQLNSLNAYGTLRSGYDLYQTSAIGGSGRSVGS